MRWTITFLHDDASYEDVTVDEAGLAGAFSKAMKREFPCHVIAVEEVPAEPVRVRYRQTEDGDEKQCVAERVSVPTGGVCDRCKAPFTDEDTDAIRLTCEEDGRAYALHERCAVEGVDGSDISAIRSLVLVVERP